MRCYITNGKVYLKISKSGRVETCSKVLAQPFEELKAKNILTSLPKTMKKLHFQLKYINDFPEEKSEINEKPISNEKEIIISSTYVVSDLVKRWVDKVKDCNGIAKEALVRKEELENAQSNVDKELSNCLHKIELEKWKNGCEGYKEYKRIKIILEKRRMIKDELLIVKALLSMNLESVAADHIEKAVNGLSNRKFSIREIENIQ